MARRGTWRRRAATWLLPAAVLACGAGPADEGSSHGNEALPAAWPEGETFSSVHALQVLGVPGVGTMVIDTAADAAGGRRVEARWGDAGMRATARDGSRPALIFPWAWSGDGHVYVAGFVCPAPTLDDFDLLDVDRVAGCGGSEVSYVIRVLDVAARRWTEVATSIPAVDDRTVSVLAAGDRSVLFGGASETDPSRPAIYRVDLASGSRTVVTSGIDGLSTCAVDGRLLGFRGGGIDASGRSTPGGFVEIRPDGVQDLGVSSGAPATFLGCIDHAMVLWHHEERATALARFSGGEVVRTRLEPFPDGGALRVVAQRNLGGTVAVWESTGTSFRLWQLGAGGWVDCDLRVEGLDPPDVVAVDGCDAIAVDPAGRIHRVDD